MSIKCIIMAGGRGERFWPKSTKNLPKQFAKIISSNSMLEETYNRFKGYLPEEDIYISSGEIYEDLIKKTLPQVKRKNLILEPMGRDTAACIALASLSIEARDDDILFFVPADHYIGDVNRYKENIEQVKNYLSENEGLVLFGVKPTEVSENYGYIEVEEGNDFKKVISFREKPTRQKAKVYLKRGNFYWNSGMFFFKKQFITQAFEQHAPHHFKKVKKYLELYLISQQKAKQVFEQIEKISFDFAVVEKLKEIHCFEGKFDWDDVGSWNALSRIKSLDENQNLIQGDVEVFNTQKTTCINDEGGMTFVLNGVNNVHIIKKGRVVYICDRRKENDIKGILRALTNKKSKLLD